MSINPATTVGELALTIPQAPRVFEKFGIDYCCGGKQALADVCNAKGTNLANVIQALSEEGRNSEDQDYSHLNQRELTEHIISRHHEFTRAEIRRLSALIEKVVSVHGTRHPELLEVRRVFGNLAEDLTPHMMKEEYVLFPYIIALEAASVSGSSCARPPFGTVQDPVRMMQFEHDSAGELLREMRRITKCYSAPADGCTSYRALYAGLREFEEDLHLHIHLENNMLFPRAIDIETKTHDAA